MAKKVKKAAAGRGSAIDSCTCRSEYQDRRYGRGRRVFNLTGTGGKTKKRFCTVCGVKKDD